MQFDFDLCINFEVENKKVTQKQQIINALKTQMTVNELYRALPHISPQNIAPLVRYLFLEKKVFSVGKKLDRTIEGIVREQFIWSSREEDRPITPMQSLFGLGVDLSKLRFTGVVVTHLCADARRGIKTKVK